MRCPKSSRDHHHRLTQARSECGTEWLTVQFRSRASARLPSTLFRTRYSRSRSHRLGVYSRAFPRWSFERSIAGAADCARRHVGTPRLSTPTHWWAHRRTTGTPRSALQAGGRGRAGKRARQGRAQSCWWVGRHCRQPHMLGRWAYVSIVAREVSKASAVCLSIFTSIGHRQRS